MQPYEVIIRLVIAVVVGGIIGYERQHQNRPAGFRTHILVCLGATIVSMVQQNSFQEAISIVTNDPIMANVIKADMGRLGAQVITGVGFLGGLAIERPAYGVGYGLSNAVMTVVLGTLFGSAGYYVSIGIQTLVLTANIGRFAQAHSQINRANTGSVA